jgi:hypothetical protein
MQQPIELRGFLQSVAGLEWLDQPLGVACPLAAVTGSEALAQYAMFYKAFVQRKKQELVSPNFIGIGEIILPRASLVHYFPANPLEVGPTTSEAFISNYPDDVFVEFPTHFTPVIGSGRAVAIEVRKVIQGYRASHYTYNWTKDIGTVYNKDKVLIVKTYGLIDKMWVARPSMFINFERHYNRYSMLMDSINAEAVKGKRKQFFRIDLPLHLPSFSELLIDYDHYIESFKDGIPHASNKTVRLTKAESSYWLMDWMAYLFGDTEYSLFGKLTPEAIDSMHLIFAFNSRSLVLHLGTLKGWLDELLESKYAPKEGKGPESHRAGHPKRLNVSKRVYLALLNLTRGGISEGEVVKEEENVREGEEAEASGSVAAAAKGSEKGKGRASSEGGGGKVSGKIDTTPTVSGGGSILDVLDPVQRVDSGDAEGTGQEGDASDPESVEEWTSHVDDTLLEQESTVTETSTAKDPFPKLESGISAALEERARDGVLTVAEQQFFMRKGTQVYKIKMENGQTLAEFIEIDDKELKTLSSDAKIEGNFPTILDESMLVSRAKVLKQGYVDKFLHKDTARMVVSIQNAGFALNDFKHTIVSGVEGSYDVYGFQVHHVDGEQSTHQIRMPRVGKDGAFMVDGVKTHLQLQRMELVVRKIGKDKVALTTHYDRKLMISRSKKVVDDLGLWMVKQVLLKASVAANGITLSRGSGYNKDLVSPRIYSLFATKFQWIAKGDITLDFRIDKLLEEYPQFKKYTKQDMFLIGVKDKKPLTIDSYGNLYLDEKEFSTIEGLLDIHGAKTPSEYAVINISGYPFPMGVVLCYYFGIDELLKVIKAETRSVPMGTRPKLGPDEYSIQFNDEYLIFNRREKLTTLIFGGMPKLTNISNFSRSDLNNKGIWGPLMGDPKVRPQQFLEMKNLYDMFIDPISKDQLKRMGYSTSFHHLLIDATKLLETDYTRHGVEIEEQRVVGYERFAGHMYRELVSSVRKFRSKGKGRKQKLDINPEAVIVNILKDTSVNLVEEVNPIHQCKDQEELTFGGTGGRSGITVVKRDRVQLDSYRGIVSEANKDSGQVGFVTYLTSDPRIEDYRGNINLKEKPSLTGINSVTGNLAFGMSKDDPKRGMFTSTQASQAVSAQNYSPNISRTGYDNIIAHRTSELYSKVASDDGKVTQVTDDMLEVTYADGTVDKYPLGLEIGEASGEYHRHTRITDMKVGDKFKKGDVLGFDKQWFTRDIFCPGQVAWNAGRMVRIALVEDQDTYEDSIAISKEIMEESVTPFIKIKRFAVDVEQVVNFRVKVGDQIDYDAILCEIEDDHQVGGGGDNELASDVNRLGIKQVRSTHHGEVVQIDVTYNSPLEKMSEGVRKFIVANDKLRKRKASIDSTKSETGSVSNNLNVNKPVLAPGKALFEIYVESMDPSTISDKYVIGNQMKGTVGSVIKKALMTRDGRKIDVKASFKGMFNRMVLSLRDKLASNEVTIQITRKFIAIYRGTNK